MLGMNRMRYENPVPNKTQFRPAQVGICPEVEPAIFPQSPPTLFTAFKPEDQRGVFPLQSQMGVKPETCLRYQKMDTVKPPAPAKESDAPIMAAETGGRFLISRFIFFTRFAYSIIVSCFLLRSLAHERWQCIFRGWIGFD